MLRSFKKTQSRTMKAKQGIMARRTPACLSALGLTVLAATPAPKSDQRDWTKARDACWKNGNAAAGVRTGTACGSADRLQRALDGSAGLAATEASTRRNPSTSTGLAR